ncbi:hypothetical protein KSF_045780 [Reticulibacter mediterranei]|uniref:Uncharacterized protein n=1 Tax=Reticulibacter mediterranei TaxID=2778369 RepID=A0A8J3IPG8_9CHLR|nr:hypothetical protein [Reticulibacter mediterranei]GHO94530.1 hypothetical protein KSF_045780 [Reticulibacter mediterranei]
MMRGILNGTLVGLLAGFPYSLSLWQAMGSDMLANALLTAGLFAFLGLGAFLLADVLIHFEAAKIRPAETFTWSWRGMCYGFLKSLSLALLGALLIGLIGVILDGIVNGVGDIPSILRRILLIESWFLWAYGPFFALIGGLFGAVTGAISGNFIDVRNITTPNQGIRRSMRNGVLVGGACMVIGGMVGGLFGEAITVQDTTHFLVFALVFGPLIGIVCGLRVGGVTCIQHFTLRWLLRDADALPWRYARFLDFAAERVLLRKVGGGYSFVHRLLLDYFAGLEP